SVFGHNQALITIFARDVLGTDAQGLGLLLSAIGAGAIAGMVLLVIVGDVRRKGAFMLGAGVLYAGMLLVFAWWRSFPLSLATRAERLRHFTAPSPRPIAQAAEAGGES